MDKFNFLNHKLTRLKQDHLLRSLECIDSVTGPVVRFEGSNIDKILFCSNNYINIAGDPIVNLAVKKAVDKYGTGSPSSRLISGTLTAHKQVEDSFTEFFHTESALLFTSGWTANQALLTSMPQKDDIVLLDKYNHASIVDAVRSCKARFSTYRRDNLQRLDKYLTDTRYKRKYIVTESVFSMDGDKADLKKLTELKNKYNAVLIVDEAHAAGCLGKTGAGLAEELGLLNEIDIIVCPLGKALGASGAIIAGPKTVTDYLINTARPFIYTTAPSPLNCAAILAGLEIILTQPQRRRKLRENSCYLRKKLNEAGLDTGKSTTHIIPVIIGKSEKTIKISKELFARGFFTSAIRPPTVAQGSSRLRISMQSNHTKEHIDALVDTLKAIIHNLKIEQFNF